MMRISGRIVPAFILVFPLCMAQAQQSSPAQKQASPDKKLSFDVATVKPSALDMQRIAADIQAGRMPKIGPEIGATRATYSFMTLNQLIAMAWSVRPYQINGPDWLGTAHFDIEATIPEGATKDDAPAMLRSLLEERFNLIAHNAQEEHKVLALVVGKSGLKIKESATAPAPFDPDSPLQPGERQVDGLDGPMRIKINPDGTVTQNMGAKGTVVQKLERQSMTYHFQSSGVTMAGYAELLSTLFLQIGGANSQQVVDMTGVNGYYQVDTAISLADLIAMARAQGFVLPTRSPSAGASGVPVASDPGEGMSVLDSVEKMGLKLEERKATVDRLVIDHVEKTPTEN